MKVTMGHEVTREHRDMIRVLFSSEYIGYVTDWEEQFLTNITREPFLTDKQLAALHKVFESITSGERDMPDDYTDEDLWGGQLNESHV